jgi:hypothetical protein
METALDKGSTRTAVIAVAVPLGLLGLAYGLWRVSDALIVIGPFDRAAFGWIFVVPLWLAAPLVAGFGWSTMSNRVVGVAASTLLLILGVASSWLLWASFDTSACQFGARTSHDGMLVPAAMIGGTLAAGVTATGLLVRSTVLDGSRRRAVVLGLIATTVAFFVTVFVAVALLEQQGCQRPPTV